MSAIRFQRFRSGYVAVGACLTIGAACAIQTPGLVRALMVVGMDAQLPLERIATDNSHPAQFADASEPLRQRAAESPVHQCKESGSRVSKDAREWHRARGYRRTITDYKYWT